MSDTLTRGVRIRVAPEYLPDESDPGANSFLFAYHITISNEGTETVKLISRRWIITDGRGHTEEVNGPGVVGQQPRLKPGENFHYSSGCPLPTPIGTMHGSFAMMTDAGDRFEARIAPFRLAQPGVLH